MEKEVDSYSPHISYRSMFAYNVKYYITFMKEQILNLKLTL